MKKVPEEIFKVYENQRKEFVQEYLSKLEKDKTT